MTTGVYKVIGHFESCDFPALIKKLSKNFYFLYVHNTLIVSIMTIDFKEEGLKALNRVFVPKKDFFIEEINQQNISNLDDISKDWALSRLTELDKERYTKENQDHLHDLWNALDATEKTLQAQLEEKERGTPDGERKDS